MFSSRALSELEARRQQLIAAAQTQRDQFQAGLEGLARSLAWTARVAGWVQAARPFFWTGTSAVGFFLARRVRTVLRLVPLLLPGWRIARDIVARLGSKPR